MTRQAFVAAVALAGVIAAYLLFFHRLGERDLWSSHEARAAQDAQTILDTGDWLLPRLYDGRAELQKPPLYYWAVAGLARLAGGPVSAWHVRLPSALAALAGLLAVFGFLARRGRPLGGALAALVLGTMVHYTWMARVGRIDLPLTCCVALTLCGFDLGRRAGPGPWSGTGWQAMAFLAAAAGVLLKGPVALALPALVGLAGLAVEGELAAACRERGCGRLLRRTGLWWGVPLVLALTVPWFVYADRQTGGEFVREFFLRHNLQRGLGGDEQLDSHIHPWWYYLATLWADLAPWGFLLPAAAWFLARHGRWQQDAAARFGATWFLTILLFLSLMKYKRPDYLLPAYPGAAILVGCVGERALGLLGQRGRRGVWLGLGGVAAACLAGWLVFVEAVLPRWEPQREYRRFAAEVRRHAPGMVLLFRIDSHALAFHLGRPTDRIWEWENLDIWACQPVPVYVVMPAECVAEWPQFLEAGRLEPVVSNTELAGGPHEQPLVLLRSRPPTELPPGVGIAAASSGR
jgi:4-amino-4-deoxy-L-arabinose transferase-like glycosyltransferase